MSVLSKSHNCPYRDIPHENLAFIEYTNGHWCFSCNRGKFKGNDYYAFKYKDGVEPVIIENEITVPDNFLSPKEFSLNLLAWLYGYYVFDDLISKYSIRYCTYTHYKTKTGQVFEGESLLFPIIINNKMVAYQQRFFPNKQFFSKNIKQHIFNCGKHKTQTVVLVEDYLSAIRVGELENCIWLQGTHLTKHILQYLLNSYLHINIWLDGDYAGQQAAGDLYKQLLNAYNAEGNNKAFSIRNVRTITNIVTELDPKCYSNEEIRGILREK